MMEIDHNSKQIIQWDVATWIKALNFWDLNVNWEKVHVCLELGGRQGGLSLWLALKNKHVICSDLENVKQSAGPLHNAYGVEHLIEYKDIDATNIPYKNHFDLIVFKSIIGGIAKDSGIETQQKVFEEIRKALKPGGILLFAENLVASPLHKFARKKFNKWGSYWRYITIQETKSFLKEYKSVHFNTTGFSAAFGRNETQRYSLAKLDNMLLNKITPASWKYVVYGMAEK